MGSWVSYWVAMTMRRSFSVGDGVALYVMHSSYPWNRDHLKDALVFQACCLVRCFSWKMAEIKDPSISKDGVSGWEVEGSVVQRVCGGPPYALCVGLGAGARVDWSFRKSKYVSREPTPFARLDNGR